MDFLNIRVLERNERLEILLNHLRIHILESGYLRDGENWNFYKIQSPFHRLYFILGGDASISSNGKATELKAGNIYFIPAGATCDYNCITEIEKVYFHINVELYPGKDIFPNTPYCTCLRDSEQLGQLLKRLFEKNDFLSAMKTQVVLNTTIFRLAKSVLKEGADIRFDLLVKYKSLFYHLSETLSAETRISELSRQLGISERRLSAEFKRDFGVGLKQYMSHLLLMRVKQLLLTTDMTVGEVAERMKYSDPFYFSRFFKKQTGLSPKAYREKALTCSVK